MCALCSRSASINWLLWEEADLESTAEPLLLRLVATATPLLLGEVLRRLSSPNAKLPFSPQIFKFTQVRCQLSCRISKRLHSSWCIGTIQWQLLHGSPSIACLCRVLPGKSTLNRAPKASDVAVECCILPTDARLHFGKAMVHLCLEQGDCACSAVLVQWDGLRD